MTELLVPGRPAEESELPKTLLSMRKLAEGQGFEVKAGYSKFYIPPEVYASGAKAGQEHGEKTVEMTWIEGINPERRSRFLAVYHDGSFDNGRWNGDMVNSTVLRKSIKGENDG